MLRAFPVSLTGATSRWLRNQPSRSITTWEILKTKFLNKYCPHAHTANKMEEINNFQQEACESVFCAWERFKELLMKCPQHYLTNMQEVILFYIGVDVPTRQILDSKAIRNQGASIKTLEIQIGQMSKVLQEIGFGSLPSSTETNPRDQVKSISTAKADFSGIRRIGCGQYVAQDVKILDAYDHTLPQKEKDPGSFTLPSFIHNICFDKALVDLGARVSVMPFSTYTKLGLGILSHTSFIILDIPEDDDVPLILRRPFLSTAHSKIDVFKRKITLRDLAETMIARQMLNSVVALRERLYFHKDQLWKDKAKVQEMGADLKVRFESLELSMDEDNIDGDMHDLGFRGQNQPLKLKVNQYYTLLRISQTQKVLEVLKNLPERSIQVIVGMGISVGKLALYTTLGGVRGPSTVIGPALVK
ncbi:hypothetical protein Tco_0256446 [Tanacetum coccineum]